MDRISHLFSLTGRVAVITGGNGLLGTEYAITLARAGAKVAVFDVQEELNDALKELAQVHPVKHYRVDITKREEVLAAVKDVEDEHGRIDVLINNAAMNPVPGTAESRNQFSPYEDYPPELWEKEFSVGMTGALFCIQAVVPVMKSQKSGSIINISSTYGVVAPDNRIYAPGQFKSIGYATVKSGMLNFTRAWASYLRGTGIRVNTLTPGGVFAEGPGDFVKKYEERTMLGRMARPDEYNGAVLFLASDASSYMTGANLIVDGGWTAW